MSLDEFFEGYPESRRLFDTLFAEIERLGEVEIRVGKSQVAFRRGKNFAFAWTPARHLKGNRNIAPLVLTVGFRHKDPSPRWKEIVEPYPGRFTHHLELFSTEDIDDEVRHWLRVAWEAAG